MDDLPDSLLLQIFSCLDVATRCLGVRLVCRRWHRVQHDHSLWQNTRLLAHFTQARLRLLMRQVGHHIQKLDCISCNLLPQLCFLDCGQEENEVFWNMKELILPIQHRESAMVTDEEMLAYVKHLNTIFPNLERLDNIDTSKTTLSELHIRSMFPNMTYIYDHPISSYGRIRNSPSNPNSEKKDRWIEDMDRISSNCAQIKAYKCMRGMQYLDTEGLRKLGMLFRELYELDLYLTSITDEALEEFFENQIHPESPTGSQTEIGCQLTKIKFHDPGTLTDRGYRILADNCPNVEVLTLNKCSYLNNHSIEYISSKCPAVKAISIDNSDTMFKRQTESDMPPPDQEKIVDSTIEVMAQNWPSLRMLKLLGSSAITDASLVHLAACRNLSHITLQSCTAIADVSHLAKLPGLKSLELRRITLKPVHVIKLISDAPALLKLTLIDAQSIRDSWFGEDDIDLMDIAMQNMSLKPANAYPSAIISLHFGNVTGEFIKVVAVMCPRIASLRIDTAKMTSMEFNRVLLYSESLTSVDISWSGIRLNESSLTTIANRGTHLKELYLGESISGLDIARYEPIFRECKFLTTFMFYDRYNEDANKVKSLITKHRHNCFLMQHLENQSDQSERRQTGSNAFLYFLPVHLLESVSTKSE